MKSSVILNSLADVRNYFTNLEGYVAWFGQTHLLCRGVEIICPNFLVVPTTLAGIRLCEDACLRYASIEHISSELSNSLVRFLTFESSQELDELAAQNQWQVLVPNLHLRRRIADKTKLPEILEAAKVPIIPNQILLSANSSDSDFYWDFFDSNSLVVQEPENNLTGRGTHLIESREHLRNCLLNLEGTSLKLTKYIPGRLVTISACATKKAIFTSYLSIQLVGIFHLTECWAAHCGNELIDEDDLSREEVAAIRNICEQIGIELVKMGFTGLFGLDLVISANGVPYVLEINPRIQSVSSLVNATEIEREKIPLQIIHIIDSCNPEILVSTKDSFLPKQIGCNFSQIVVTHKGSCQLIQQNLTAGIYQYQIESSKLELISVGADMFSLADSSQLLITPFCSRGEIISSGQRMMFIQRRGRMTDKNGSLLPEIVLAVEQFKNYVLRSYKL